LVTYNTCKRLLCEPAPHEASQRISAMLWATDGCMVAATGDRYQSHMYMVTSWWRHHDVRRCCRCMAGSSAASTEART